MESKRAAVATSETKIHNPFSGVADRTLSFLEYIFLPSHLRPPPEAGVGISERLIILLRRPSVLVILVVIILIIVALCY